MNPVRLQKMTESQLAAESCYSFSNDYKILKVKWSQTG